MYQPSATKYQKPCGFLEREEKLKNNDFPWSTAKLVSGICHEEHSMEQKAARHSLSSAFSDAVKGNVPVTAEHYDNIPYYQSVLGKPIPSVHLQGLHIKLTQYVLEFLVILWWKKLLIVLMLLLLLHGILW